jgi:hypothetical protein
MTLSPDSDFENFQNLENPTVPLEKIEESISSDSFHFIMSVFSARENLGAVIKSRARKIITARM